MAVIIMAGFTLLLVSGALYGLLDSGKVEPTTVDLLRELMKKGKEEHGEER